MSSIKLRIAELRKFYGIGQRELADAVGVTYQSVSKWETNICMPDIYLLPVIADYFKVTVDELLGLKPIKYLETNTVKTDSLDYWKTKLDYLKRSRSSFWNMDYFQFLIEKVWNITEAVDIIDYGCGFGYLGSILLPFLPHGSTYTGIDINEAFLEEAKNYFNETEFQTEFILEDLYTYQPKKKYDIAICQAVLRHFSNPKEILSKMKNSVKSDGLVICFEVCRELESDGFYIDGIDYDYLCARNGFQKMWKEELKDFGRDYAIGMRIPFMMNEIGLKNVDVRMNDKVNFVTPISNNYDESLQNFQQSNGWNNIINDEEYESKISFFIGKGFDRGEAEAYVRKQNAITNHLKANKDNAKFLQFRGFLISYGTK